MVQKLLLSAILLFCCILICDISPRHKSKLPIPVLDFANAMQPDKKIKASFTPFWETAKKNNAVDTAALKQSNWYADVMRNIEASEYEIKRDDKTGLYMAPNRQQQLRSSFTYNSFTLQPRSIEQDWVLRMQLSGIYANKKLIAQPTENDLPVIGSNKIVFNNESFSTEYINSKEGVRQNFIIQKEPAGKPQTINIKLQTGKSWYINKVHDKELHFAKREGGQLSKKITYNSLKVWDANNKELTARFVVNKKHSAFEIEVKTADAVYPITIDPISTTPAAIVESGQADAQMGRQVSSAGDVNGDGYGDVIVGAWLYDNGQTDEGVAFIYHGSPTGISTTAAIMLEADQAFASFGSGVAGAGDVNRDGYSDVIVGAYLYDNVEAEEGAAFVYHGSATGIGAVPAAMVESNQVNAQMGFFTAGAGDVNGDGYSDIIVGANLYDNSESDEGAAFIYHGSAAGIITTAAAMVESNQASTNFGREVAGAGDVNGDGYSDVIVGAWGYDNGENNEGAAFVYHGSAAGIITTAAVMLESDQADATLGISVASAGDVNGDGYSDLIVGAYFYDNGQADEGAAFIYLGSASGISATAATVLDNNQAVSRFGAAVDCAGDLNGDGYSDVIVGSYFYDNGQADEGAVFVYYGSTTGINVTPVARLESNQANAVFGIALSAAGDVNGDGYSDIIAGAFWYDNGQSDEGGAFIYHGGPNGLSAAQTRILNPENQSLAGIGNAVASAGDVNGDGYSDVIVGSGEYDDVTNTNEGRAWVYYGHATGLSATPDVTLDDANQADAYFGYSVAAAGDVNGDGFGDVVVGAYLYDGGNTDEGRAWVHYGSAGGLSVAANRILDDANQDGAGFGISVACAGDVNGDGYSDVIVGAYSYDDPSPAHTNEGRAFVYFGSAAGLAATPSNTPDDADQTGAILGGCVASAGDVNGDGYSDVIIAATGYDDTFADEGVAFIYFGGVTGLSAIPDQMLDDANQTTARLGSRVAGIGDVNGDGFADVLVTSIFYDGDRGRGWVYYGHATTGLSSTPDVLFDNTAGNPLDRLGYSGSGAGDVNGDGYSDVIVGMPQRWFSFIEDGQAYIYYGSSAGLPATPSLIIHDATEDHEFFGSAAAGAGDINGDGYSDVIVGAPHGSYATAFGGRVYVHNGNDSISNRRNNLRLYNSDLSTLINSSNFIFANFGAGLFAKSFLGRDKGKLVWETRLNYNAYSGTPITNSTFFTAEQGSYTDLGLAGVELKNLIDKLLGSSRYTKLRARVKYDPVTAITGQIYGPWRNVSAIIDGNSMGALPIELISFNAAWLQRGKTAKINFTTDKENGICCFDIEKSSDGFNFYSIGSLPARNIPGLQSYSFIDNNASNKKQFYRLKIKGIAGQVDYSNIQQLQNNGAIEILVFPNPTTDILQLQLNGDYNKMNIQVINSAGQSVKQLNNLSVSNQTLTIPVKDLAAGNYWLHLQTGTNMQVLQFVKQ